MTRRRNPDASSFADVEAYFEKIPAQTSAPSEPSGGSARQLQRQYASEQQERRERLYRAEEQEERRRAFYRARLAAEVAEGKDDPQSKTRQAYLKRLAATEEEEAQKAAKRASVILGDLVLLMDESLRRQGKDPYGKPLVTAAERATRGGRPVKEGLTQPEEKRLMELLFKLSELHEEEELEARAQADETIGKARSIIERYARRALMAEDEGKPFPDMSPEEQKAFQLQDMYEKNPLGLLNAMTQQFLESNRVRRAYEEMRLAQRRRGEPAPSIKEEAEALAELGIQSAFSRPWVKFPEPSDPEQKALWRDRFFSGEWKYKHSGGYPKAFEDIKEYAKLAEDFRKARKRFNDRMEKLLQQALSHGERRTQGRKDFRTDSQRRLAALKLADVVFPYGWSVTAEGKAVAERRGPTPAPVDPRRGFVIPWSLLSVILDYEIEAPLSEVLYRGAGKVRSPDDAKGRTEYLKRFFARLQDASSRKELSRNEALQLRAKLGNQLIGGTPVSVQGVLSYRVSLTRDTAQFLGDVLRAEYVSNPRVWDEIPGAEDPKVRSSLRFFTEGLIQRLKDFAPKKVAALRRVNPSVPFESVVERADNLRALGASVSEIQQVLFDRGVSPDDIVRAVEAISPGESRVQNPSPFVGPLRVQSLLVPKDRYTLAQARRWAKEHGYKAAVDASEDYFRFRQREPKENVRATFRTIDFGTSGIKAVVAVPREFTRRKNPTTLLESRQRLVEKPVLIRESARLFREDPVIQARIEQLQNNPARDAVVPKAGEGFKTRQKDACGTFGCVSFWQDPATQSKYVVKRMSLPRESPDFESRIAGALRELRGLARTLPGNLPTLFDFKQSEEMFEIAMPMAEGLSLFEYLDAYRAVYLTSPSKEERKKVTRRYVRVALGLCEAVRDLHALGLSHNDLSLSNVFTTTGDNPKVSLIDLGASTRFGKPVAGLGTPGYGDPRLYLSTEQPPETDAAFDTYSVCSIIYAMFSVEADSPAWTAAMDIPALRRLWDRVSPRGESVSFTRGASFFKAYAEHYRKLGGFPLLPEDPRISQPLAELLRRGLHADPSKRPSIEALISALSKEAGRKAKAADKVPSFPVQGPLFENKGPTGTLLGATRRTR